MILVLFILPLFCSFLGCGKDNSEPEEKIPEGEVTFESGEGGLFIGSIRDNEFFNFKISKHGTSAVIKSGAGHGRVGNKALSNDCKFTKQNFGQFLKLQEGKYLFFLEIVGEPNKQNTIEIEIIAGKCSSLEVRGVAW